jgi:hypothetical protein
LTLAPHTQVMVGVVVERRKALSPWIDFTWRSVAVLSGQPDAAPWTLLSTAADRATFYAGTAVVDLFRTETTNYISNLRAEAPQLWIALRPTGGETPFTILTVTADPAEGEALTETGADLVDVVPMPDSVRQLVEAFCAQHHVERPFQKRVRDKPDLEALGRRKPGPKGSPA